MWHCRGSVLSGPHAGVVVRFGHAVVLTKCKDRGVCGVVAVGPRAQYLTLGSIPGSAEPARHPGLPLALNGWKEHN